MSKKTMTSGLGTADLKQVIRTMKKIHAQEAQTNPDKVPCGFLRDKDTGFAVFACNDARMIHCMLQAIAHANQIIQREQEALKDAS